ncbi:hypothetical protein WJX77_001488 [Trebouxia sp. C0004]
MNLCTPATDSITVELQKRSATLHEQQNQCRFLFLEVIYSCLSLASTHNTIAFTTVWDIHSSQDSMSTAKDQAYHLPRTLC